MYVNKMLNNKHKVFSTVIAMQPNGKKRRYIRDYFSIGEFIDKAIVVEKVVERPTKRRKIIKAADLVLKPETVFGLLFITLPIDVQRYIAYLFALSWWQDFALANFNVRNLLGCPQFVGYFGSKYDQNTYQYLCKTCKACSSYNNHCRDCLRQMLAGIQQNIFGHTWKGNGQIELLCDITCSEIIDGNHFNKKLREFKEKNGRGINHNELWKTCPDLGWYHPFDANGKMKPYVKRIPFKKSGRSGVTLCAVMSDTNNFLPPNLVQDKHTLVIPIAQCWINFGCPCRQKRQSEALKNFLRAWKCEKSIIGFTTFFNIMCQYWQSCQTEIP